MAKNTKIPIYSFDLWERFDDTHSVMPVTTLTIENDFEHFPTSLDIANYLAEHKGHFLSYFLTKGVKVNPLPNIRGAAYISVTNGKNVKDYSIIGIRQIK